MKFMKLGARPDTFYTEEATRSANLSLNPIISNKVACELYLILLVLQCRSVISDIPSDLVIRINNITYLLHKV